MIGSIAAARRRSAGGDPFWSNVILFVHGEGADASTSFIDHSLIGRALTANGNVQNDTGQDVHGESILLDGTGDYISAADAADIRLDGASGSADFCFECYAFITNLAHNNTLISKLTSGNTGYRLFVSSAGKLTLNFLAAGVVRLSVVSANSVPTNQITHLALSRASGTGRVFIDGNLEATAAQTAAPTAGNTAIMGMGWDIRSGASGFEGSFNWCRLTSGVPRYTASFTPPATPLPMS